MTMKQRPSEWRCSYVVVLQNESSSTDDLKDLAAYLSNLSVNNVDIAIVDGSPLAEAEENRRILRWVGRYFLADARHANSVGSIDRIRAAMAVAACEKVIVADARVRYQIGALDHLSALMDLHEVVEPQDYFDPLPWWGGIEAGRMLLHRGIGPHPDHGSTFGFRKRALQDLRSIDVVSPADDCVRHLASQGAEVFSAIEVFVRRTPPLLGDWLRARRRHAGDDLATPARATFFFTLLPVALMLELLGGMRFAIGYLGAIGVGALALAIRGRIGAAAFFPLRACLYAPLWLLERSISVYWVMLRRLSGTSEPPRLPIAERARVASGE